ncbi:MAG: hypothetical protein IPL52_04575 [Flavobacteriales bacterium]|nr:hypothetical protein [Flavobacteriales bacterium]
MKRTIALPACFLLVAANQVSLAHGQFRLDLYTPADPVKNALVQADGSSLFAMRIEDTDVVLKTDAQGQPQWAREVTDPAIDVLLLETSNSTITRVDAYAPVILPNPPWQDDTVVVRVRLARVDASGTQIWSKTVATSFVQPYEFTITHTQLSGVQASDDGTIISLLSYAASMGPSVLHVMKHDDQGNLLWCKRYGHNAGNYFPWAENGAASRVEVQLGPSDDGGAIALDCSRIQSRDWAIMRIDANGDPIACTSYEYLGAGPSLADPVLAVGPAGDVLVSIRTGSGANGSIALYRFSEDLDLIDKDIYYDMGVHEIDRILHHADGHAMLQMKSLNSADQTWSWLETDETGELVSAYKAPTLPFENGQQLHFVPKGTGFSSDGLCIPYVQRISHPVLGNLGHFTGLAIPDQNSGASCYFLPHSAQHLSIPDSLVNVQTEVLPTAIEPTLVSTTSQSFVSAPIVATIPGCVAQVSVPGTISAQRFHLVPNPARRGEPLSVFVDQPSRLALRDPAGRPAGMEFYSPVAGTFAWPWPELAAGIYLVVRTSPRGEMIDATKLVIE